MKKISFLILILLLPTFIFSDNVITHTGVVESDLFAEMSASLSLATINSEEMGFSSNKVESFDASVSNLQSIEFSIKNDEKQGIMNSVPFYFYWKILSNSSAVPTISLSISNPLRSTKPAANMNWKASLTYQKDGKNFSEVISSSGKTVSGNIPIVSSSMAANQLFSSVGCVSIVLETEDVYWERPAAFYEALITVNVASGT